MPDGKRVFVAGGWIYLDHNNRIVAPRGTIRAWIKEREKVVVAEINIDGEKYYQDIKIA